MRKTSLFLAALVFSIATCSQTGGVARDAFQVKNSVFFEDDTLDEYTTTEWNSSFTHVDNEVRFSASGAMIEQVEYAYNEDKNQKTTKLTRDVESRLKNRIVYQYNPQGLLWREALLDNKGKVVSTFEFAYDGRGNQISRVIKDRQGRELARTLYTYNSSGRMVTSETRDIGENVISSTRYTYDGQGNLVNQQVINSEGQVTAVVSSVWQGGFEMRNEMASANGRVQMRITNEYGTNSELTKKTIENFQGESKQTIRYEYTFRPRRQS
jgi:hypothetical protein